MGGNPQYAYEITIFSLQIWREKNYKEKAKYFAYFLQNIFFAKKPQKGHFFRSVFTDFFGLSTLRVDVFCSNWVFNKHDFKKKWQKKMFSSPQKTSFLFLEKKPILDGTPNQTTCSSTKFSHIILTTLPVADIL